MRFKPLDKLVRRMAGVSLLGEWLARGDYRYGEMDVKGVRVVLDCVAKHEATKLIRDVLAGRREREEIRQKFKSSPGRQWLQLCKYLEVRWMHELWLSTL